MSEYYDKFGMLRPEDGKDGENDIVFIAYEDVYRDIGKERAHLILYLHIHKDGYIQQTPIDARYASHDNITAFLYLAKKYDFKFSLKLSQVLKKYWHPRDLLFLMGIKNNPFLLFSVFPRKKSSPNIFARLWIKLTAKYEHTVELPGGTQAYYRKKDGTSVVIEEFEETTDGKLLNLLRFRRNGLGLIGHLAHFFAKRSFGSMYLSKWFIIYFRNDSMHPMILFSMINAEVDYVD